MDDTLLKEQIKKCCSSLWTGSATSRISLSFYLYKQKSKVWLLISGPGLNPWMVFSQPTTTKRRMQRVRSTPTLSPGSAFPRTADSVQGRNIRPCRRLKIEYDRLLYLFSYEHSAVSHPPFLQRRKRVSQPGFGHGELPNPRGKFMPACKAQHLYVSLS